MSPDLGEGRSSTQESSFRGMKRRISIIILLFSAFQSPELLFRAAGSIQAAEGSTGKEAKAVLWAQQGIKKNYYFLSVLNPALSNYGGEEERRVYRRCVNLYLKSQILLLASRYNDSYKMIRRTQYLLIQLYERVVERSRLHVLARLKSYSSRVVYAGNQKARKYLALGLRDLEVARIKVLMERNTRPWLYLMKLQELVEAQKMVRHANRYHILLALELDSIYPVDAEEITFLSGQRLIISGFPSRRSELLLQHSDNYFRVGAERRNLLEIYRSSPSFTELNHPIPGWRFKEAPRLR